MMKSPLVKWAVLFMSLVFAQHFAFKHLAPDMFKNLDMDNVFANLSSTQKKTNTVIETLDGEVIVPLEKRRGKGWIIQVELNELYIANLVVDTGATYTAISENLSFDIGLTPDPRYKPISTQTANGTGKAWVTHLQSIRAGDVELNNFMVFVSDFSNFSEDRISGLLGLNFLDNFDWRLDQQNEVLILQSKT